VGNTTLKGIITKGCCRE